MRPVIWCVGLLVLAAGHLAVLAGRPDQLRTVHLVYANHLDVGFTATDDVVINKYFHEYYPKAIAVAEELKKRTGPERLVYTTHSFLVSLFLDCPRCIGVTCPTDDEVTAFKQAVAEGVITWHAMPFNAQLEFYDAPLVEAAVQLTHDLDALFGLPPKVTMSQRDVPGTTRAALPLLYGQGVRAISVGVNAASAPPAVPHDQAFIWRDEASQTDMLAMFHPGGYSGGVGDTPVDGPNNCIQADGFDHALCCAWRGDNAGPPDVDEVLRVWAKVQGNFPGAQVLASGFDDFMTPFLEAVPQLRLPIITQEIGDSWIYGVPSDAGKTSEYRDILRQIRAAGSAFTNDAGYKNASRFLLKVGEHTWGTDSKWVLADWVNWDNPSFHRQLQQMGPNYATTIQSWLRQRKWLDWALDALEEGAPLKHAMLAARDAVRDRNKAPNPEALGFHRMADGDDTLSSHAWDIRIHPETGALAGLRFRWPGSREGADWASKDHPLGQVVYNTYTEGDYQVIFRDYSYCPAEEWAQLDFGKHNCNVAHPRHAAATASLTEVWHKGDGEVFEVLVRSRLPDWMVTDAGAPEEVWTHIQSPKNDASLLYDVIWVNKTATRLPEALWVKFAPDPALVNASSWAMYKLGRPILPANVVRNGSYSQHGVTDEGVTVTAAGAQSWEKLQIKSFDAAVVSPGEATPFPNPLHPPDMTKGMSFNLANNIWGTNYIMWQPYRPEDRDMRFRFALQVHDVRDAGHQALFGDKYAVQNPAQTMQTGQSRSSGLVAVS
ncbi:hypothetical protein WJX72_001843 [[Myrmecia] bisecta]|uniref:Glycoside hydrolase family 38 N-terminal domain-containing protein n=1 Tax=[Myrmecia] bisecta TaxID=41462 RepID=A0AAW1Q2M0_9CHLO